jgi:glycosyltransferase involved in cell wall biosynthesis
MRFIYHHRTAGRGGEAVHISGVVRALRSAGHNVDVVSPPGVDPMANAETPLDKGNASVRGINRIWKWVSRSSPQILFELLEVGYNAYAAIRLFRAFRRAADAAFYERYAFFLAAGVWTAKLCKRRVILEVNEVAGVERAREQRLVGLARFIERRVFASADEIVTVSSFLKGEILSRGGRSGHVHVVPNAVDPVRFQGRTGVEIRDRLGLVGYRVIGFVGWFDKWDRLDRLVNVVASLPGAGRDVRLLLVGDGPVLDDLRSLLKARNLEQVVVLSGAVPRSSIPDYIDAMDICVLPDSNAFGSPIVLFEFMAMGKAIVAPDLAPIRDVVRSDETGIIVPRNDDAALQAAVERLVVNPVEAATLGQAAQTQVFEQHTWAAVGKIVERLAGGPARANSAPQVAKVRA